MRDLTGRLKPSEPKGILVQPVGTYKGVEGLHKLFAAAALSPSRRDHGSALMALRRVKRKGLRPQQRLAPAIEGGNWQGTEYLTYAEHDFCVRAARLFARPGMDRKWCYRRARSILLAERLEKRKVAA